jgi:hypothetical protein
MPSKSRLFSQLIAGSGQIKADRLSDDISTIEQVATTEDLTAVGNTVGDQRVINNNLYIWNGSGWYRIALINASPTWDSGGQPAASYELDADSPQDATVITLAASDPDGLSISYNYVTSGSMDSMATISQDSSVFTITPKTVSEVGEGAELTGSITFRASDGVNILPYVSSFTLSFISIIENSRYTTLLATAVDTSDNNNITDASSNNHTITVNGDAHAGTFSPYRSGGYSTYFDGNGDYLEVPQSSNSSSFGTGEFTVEFWFKPSEAGSTVFFIDFRGSANSGFQIFRRSTNFIRVRGLNQTTLIDGTTSISDFNTWYHICVHRNSSNELKLFINGAQDGGTVTGHTTDYAHPTSGNWLIGKQYNSTSYPNGYMRDVRIVKGTAITPTSGGPTERLEAVTNTTLLTCHLPYISDGSTNDHSITVNGNVSTKPFSPYDYSEYDAADHGGSVYTSGTESLGVSSFSSFSNIGTGDYTLECWHYNDTANSGVGLDFRDAAGIALVSSSGSLRAYYVTGTIFASTATGVITPRQWNHLVFCRISGILKGYLNGKEVFSVNDTTNLSGSSNTVYIGNNAAASSALNGYYSSVRMTNKGVYTGEFTPPTTPLSTTQSSGTNISAVASGECKLLVKGTDASIIDKSQGANLKLFGTTTGSTGQVRTGDWANTKTMYFDGNSDYITIPNNELYGFGTGDWTIETWLYCTKTGGFNAIFDTRVGSGTQSGNFGIGMYNTGRIQLFSGGIFYYPTNTLSFNTWQHFAVVKNSGTTTMYFNGTAASSTYSDSRDYGSSQPVQIGKDDTASNYFGGYMQDFRITKDLARYTANFTPPSAPLEG